MMSEEKQIRIDRQINKGQFLTNHFFDYMKKKLSGDNTVREIWAGVDKELVLDFIQHLSNAYDEDLTEQEMSAKDDLWSTDWPEDIEEAVDDLRKVGARWNILRFLHDTLNSMVYAFRQLEKEEKSAVK